MHHVIVSLSDIIIIISTFCKTFKVRGELYKSYFRKNHCDQLACFTAGQVPAIFFSCPDTLHDACTHSYYVLLPVHWPLLYEEILTKPHDNDLIYSLLIIFTFTNTEFMY